MEERPEVESSAEERSPAKEPSASTHPVQLVADPEYRGQLPGALALLLALLQPILGALPSAAKDCLEQYAAHRGFRATWATWLNLLLNAGLYLVAGWWVGSRAEGGTLPSLCLGVGVGYTLLESLVRLWPVARPGLPRRLRYRGALYGWVLGALFWPLLDTMLRPIALKHAWDVSPKKPVPEGIVRVPGEIEKRRRYGMVHRVRQTEQGYRIELEFPRQTPVGVLARRPDLPTELPHYRYTVRVDPERGLIVFAVLDDPRFQEVLGRDADFPGSFETVFALDGLGPIARTHYDPERRVLTVDVARIEAPQAA
ncbi:MAG: hypothetical protein KatS3mg115_1341 [Candidatus Poribacteria bacterium]|nr:MAG: hypothetical protein KatS3mg115_1341 [Candidatus Poribacteria bacterium]